MKQAGRANWLMVVGLIGIVVVAVIFLTSGESASSAAGRFMVALGQGKVDDLTKLSFMDGETPEQISKKWEYTTQVVGKFYRFRWQILAETQPQPDQAAVRLWVWRDAQTQSAYEEHYEIPMVKKEGKWLVDVRGLNRTMYPGLPR
jgi:hypothetical protein